MAPLYFCRISDAESYLYVGVVAAAGIAVGLLAAKILRKSYKTAGELPSMSWQSFGLGCAAPILLGLLIFAFAGSITVEACGQTPDAVLFAILAPLLPITAVPTFLWAAFGRSSR